MPTETVTETPAAPPATPVTPPVETPVTPPPSPAVVTPPVTPTPPSEPVPPAAPVAKAPEKYELVIAADSRVTPEMLPAIEANAKALGLTNEQAQKFYELKNTELANYFTETARFLDDVKADPKLGGTNFDATQQDLKRGLDWMLKDAPEDEVQFVRDTFNGTGFGNHKAFIRMVAKVGRGFREDTPVAPGGGTPIVKAPLANRLVGDVPAAQ